jgi:hypothetical protein
LAQPGNGSLTNAEYGCVGVSYDSGPPSTIWAKPLEGGRTALLVINGRGRPPAKGVSKIALRIS